MTSSIWPLAR